MSTVYFGEYGCPKGQWGMSKIIKPEFFMNYRGQKVFNIELPVVDCIKEMDRNHICDNCPVNGKVESNLIKMWENYSG
ncbi:hypothetical protein LCGC14_1615640 [marine sediment metagenome]|uniref:Uncharacterized protein n=1 Tax=marine sediment metagenome TaxID=412755 RepID=A0A0F9IRX1_9ZZZZ